MDLSGFSLRTFRKYGPVRRSREDAVDSPTAGLRMAPEFASYERVGLPTVPLENEKSCDPCQIQTPICSACREHCVRGRLAQAPCLPQLNPVYG
jgi:hypothetical protein